MQLNTLQQLIKNEQGVLLYFMGEHCSVCQALRPKYQTLFSAHFPLIKQIFLDAHEHAQIAAHFQVYAIPTAIIFLDGKEFMREGRSVSLHQLQEKLHRPYMLLTQG